MTPPRSKWLLRWFKWYARRYCAKHFHAIRISRSSVQVPQDGRPLLFVLNHPSWWDAMLLFVAGSAFPNYRHYAPMEATMLRRYRMFAKLGLFGVDNSTSGMRTLLRTANAIFSEANGALWMTAQGRFADVRERPLNLRPGIGAVASRMNSGNVVPVAVEYAFWDERTPEALVRIGDPLEFDPSLSAADWKQRAEEALTETMDALADESIRRDPSQFDTLLQGRVGVGGVYDFWRRAKSALVGRKADLAHRREREAVSR